MPTATPTKIDWNILSMTHWDSADRYQGMPTWTILHRDFKDYRLFRNASNTVEYFTTLAEAKRFAEEN